MKGLRRLCQYSKAVEVDRLCDRELALSVPGTGKSHRTIILRQRFSSGPGQGYWVIYNCQHATYVLARRVSVGSVTVPGGYCLACVFVHSVGSSVSVLFCGSLDRRNSS